MFLMIDSVAKRLVSYEIGNNKNGESSFHFKIVSENVVYRDFCSSFV